MTLAELRKLSVRRQVRIRFALSNGLECVVTEHGIAEIPALRSVPDFSLENELAGATRFTLETVSTDDRKKAAAARPQALSRAEVDAMVGSGGPEPVHHDEHDE